MFKPAATFLIPAILSVLLTGGLAMLAEAGKPQSRPAIPQIDAFALMSDAADLPEQVCDSPI